MLATVPESLQAVLGALDIVPEPHSMHSSGGVHAPDAHSAATPYLNPHTEATNREKARSVQLRGCTRACHCCVRSYAWPHPGISPCPVAPILSPNTRISQNLLPNAPHAYRSVETALVLTVATGACTRVARWASEFKVTATMQASQKAALPACPSSTPRGSLSSGLVCHANCAGRRIPTCIHPRRMLDVHAIRTTPFPPTAAARLDAAGKPQWRIDRLQHAP